MPLIGPDDYDVEEQKRMEREAKRAQLETELKVTICAADAYAHLAVFWLCEAISEKFEMQDDDDDPAAARLEKAFEDSARRVKLRAEGEE